MVGLFGLPESGGQALQGLDRKQLECHRIGWRLEQSEFKNRSACIIPRCFGGDSAKSQGPYDVMYGHPSPLLRYTTSPRTKRLPPHKLTSTTRADQLIQRIQLIQSWPPSSIFPSTLSTLSSKLPGRIENSKPALLCGCARCENPIHPSLQQIINC
jgi:hypothetical protein